MGWSLNLGTYAGTAVRIHFTFFLLLAWIGFSNAQTGGVPGAIDGMVFVSLVFACVLLHEFGHALAARRYGIKTPDITLLPIGGIARLERMPEDPGREVIVALAGPAVNVVLALVFIVLLGGNFSITSVEGFLQTQESMLGRLAFVNIVLVVFNLIPAFPMDGGRVLRAVLSLQFGRIKATQYAAYAGQALALGFGVLALMGGSPILILIAVFIFFAANAESQQVRMSAATSGRRAYHAVITRFESLAPHNTARDAGNMLLTTTQQEFPVLDAERTVLGFVTRAGLIKALREQGPDTSVIQFMEREVETISAHAALESAIDALRSSPARCVAVKDDDGRFVGYISAENLTELFMLADARGGRWRPRHAA